MLFDDYNKKNSDVAQENPAGINGGSVTAQPAYDSLLGGIAAGKERIGNAIKEWGKPVSPKESEERFKSSFTEYMMPSDTPDRRKRVYALSQQSLDDVVGEYYNNRIKPLFERYKSEIVRLYPNATVKEPIFEPVVGCAACRIFDSTTNISDELKDRLIHGFSEFLYKKQ